MSTAAYWKVEDRQPDQALQLFFRAILGLEGLSAILVPRYLPGKTVVMPALISDPEELALADPLAPSFPLNAARMVSRLTRKPAGSRIAVVLRSCEIRAFIELVKLKQGRLEDLVMIGLDCLGAYSNRDYARIAGDEPFALTRRFTAQVLAGEGSVMEGVDIAPACRICSHPVPEQADILIGLIGVDVGSRLLLQAQTASGEKVLTNLGLAPDAVPGARSPALDQWLSERQANREAILAETEKKTGSLEALAGYLAGCVNCYNCRVACPVCYCKECVFATDVFYHEPYQYLKWAHRKGALKMPTDTLFFHLTRMMHMSTACVGCGQCSNACPNDIPVMELFAGIAARTQQVFDYHPGMDREQPPPMSEFCEQEFEDLVGIHTEQGSCHES